MSERTIYDPGFWTETSLIQLGYGLWVNLTYLGIGLAVGFSAITIPQLSAPDSTITASLSDMSWITSVLTLACPMGCLVSGIMMDKLGRRLTLVLGQVPISLGWYYTGYADSAMDMIIGRIITGAGCGMAMGSPRAYLTEISLPNMRGVIGALPNVALSLGIMTQASLGIYLNWEKICIICGIFSTTLMFLNICLPETPYYVLMKNNIQKAKETLKKFRGKNYTIDAEMEQLVDFKRENDIRRLPLKATFVALVKASACRPFSILMPYVLVAQLSGIAVVMFWTIDMLQASRSTIDPNIGNVSMAVTRLFSGILMSILLFKVGRKPLALTSAVGVGIVCISLGIFIIHAPEPNIFPQLCYMAYVLLGSLGYYTLPTLIMYEVYPLQIRGLLGGISVSLESFLAFGSNKSYPYVRNAIGFPYTVVLFGVWSLLGSIYLYLFLPETKGLTLQEIEEYFNNRRSTLRSEREIIDSQLATSSNSGQIVKIGSHKSLVRHKLDKIKKMTADKNVETTNTNEPSDEKGRNSGTSGKKIVFKYEID